MSCRCSAEVPGVRIKGQPDRKGTIIRTNLRNNDNVVPAFGSENVLAAKVN